MTSDDTSYRVDALGDDARVAFVQDDPEPEDLARVLDKAAVTEVETQKIGVTVWIELAAAAHGAWDSGLSRGPASIRAGPPLVHAPVEDRATRNARKARDLAVVHPPAHEPQRVDLRLRPHRPACTNMRSTVLVGCDETGL